MKFIIYIFILINTSIYSQGFVTPESEGSIQKCFDSEYTCKLTQLTYDIYNTLIVSKSKIINGNNATLILKNNVDVIVVSKKLLLPWDKHKGVKIYNLNINTSEVEHNRAGIRFDINSRIMDITLRDILITGKKSTLYSVGMGTKALWIGSDLLTARDPFLHNLYFENVKTEYCAEGLYIPHNGSLWVNTITGVNFITWGNKRSIFNEIADIINIDIIMQFIGVLPEKEKDFAAITLKKYARNTNIKYFPFDSSRQIKDLYYRPLISDITETYEWNGIKKSNNILIRL